jgi:hypothetical protein
MVDTGHGRRPEGQNYTGARTPGRSVASEQAAANSRSTAPRNVSTPTGDDERSMNARHSYRDSPPTGRGGHRRAEELESRDSDYETTSDMDDLSSGEDWYDDAVTLADVEMEDGTGASGNRNPLLSGSQRTSYIGPMASLTATPGRNLTPYTQWDASPGTSTRPNLHVVHGYSSGTSTGYSPTPRYTRESAKICIVSRTSQLAPSNSRPALTACVL